MSRFLFLMIPVAGCSAPLPDGFDDLRALPEVASVEASGPADAPRLLIHVRDYHYIPRHLYAIDFGGDKDYGQFLDRVEEIQKQQVAALRHVIRERGVKVVFAERVTQENLGLFQDRVETFRKLNAMLADAQALQGPKARAMESEVRELIEAGREDFLDLGAAGRLAVEGGEVEVLPLDDESKPGQGGVSYPSLGAIVSAEIGDPDAPLPNYMATGTPGLKQTSLATSVVGSGYLGPRHQPLVPTAAGLENLQPRATDFDDRIAVLEQLEQGFARTTRSSAAEAHQTIQARAVQLIRSGKGQTAFDLSQEPAEARAAYGETGFGRNCLLARRLVEAGVAFVEIVLPGWDTHDERTALAAKGLMTQVDHGMATLIGDLKSRGLLDSTLVIWMGEFGRTPQTNGKGGRDHYARAWSTVLAGGGIQGGQTIGKTDQNGAAVAERPITVVDFMATVCQILGIDYTKKREMPNGRPIRLVDKGANPIKELLGVGLPRGRR